MANLSQLRGGNDVSIYMTTTLIKKIFIRPWHEADYDNAVTLNRDAETHIGMISETGDWAQDMEGIADTFIKSGGEFFIGTLGQKFVVMGGFKKVSSHKAEIKRMRVTPTLQGRGIGRWFLSVLETKMLESGVTTVNVSTTSKQEGALRLYSGAGYTETERRVEDRAHDNGLIIVSFTKELKASV